MTRNTKIAFAMFVVGVALTAAAVWNGY